MKHREILRHVDVSRPYPYDEFIALVAASAYVITDSGGLQEETSFMRKRSIVCRKTTERSEGLKEFSVLCPEPENLIPLFDEMIDKPEPTAECPYGDGRSAERIVDILLEEL
jgi:UDP-N-acetylglucosamine 2-epimerase (non-hydrolysing)